MRFPSRLAFIHPIWFVAVAAAAFVVPIFTLGGSTDQIVWVALITGWLALLPLGWTHGIYKTSRLALAKSSALNTNREWVFYLAEIGIVCMPLIFLGAMSVQDTGGVLEFAVACITFVVFGSFFSSYWLSAASLIAFEEGTSQIAFHKVFGTFVLMFYWIIGAWMMQGRLKALRRAFESAAPATA